MFLLNLQLHMLQIASMSHRLTKMCLSESLLHGREKGKYEIVGIGGMVSKRRATYNTKNTTTAWFRLTFT